MPLNKEEMISMTEKRFTVPDRYRFSHSKVQLNGEPLTNDEIVRVLNVNDGAFVENLHLKKENRELKEERKFAGLLANHRGEMVSFANALIQDLDDEKIQDMWEKFKDGMYKEWKQKRGIE